MSSIGDSLIIHRRSINAITLRLMQSRFTKSRFGFLITITEPIIVLCVLYFIRVFLRSTTSHHGVPMAVFLTTGYLNHYAFRNVLLGVSRQAQMGSRLLALPQVTVIDAIFAELLTSWMTYTCAFFVLATAAVVVTHAYPPADPFQTLMSFNCGMWIGLYLGVFLGVLLRYVPSLILIINPMLRVGMFFSGAIMSADEMPKWTLPYLSWNPVFHATELLREGWSASYHSPVADAHYVIICGIIGTALAFTLERMTRHMRLG